MPRAAGILFALLATAGHGGQLGVSYHHPFHSPLDAAEGSEESLESRGGASAGFYFEPAPFLAIGPEVGWSFWDFDLPLAEDGFLRISKWEFAGSVMPTLRIARHAQLFLKASMGLQYLDYAVKRPSGTEEWARRSKSEWGSGRSVGMGLDLYWIRLSIHHDAVLAESLPEFAGLRGAIGVVFRNRP